MGNAKRPKTNHHQQINTFACVEGLQELWGCESLQLFGQRCIDCHGVGACSRAMDQTISATSVRNRIRSLAVRGHMDLRKVLFCTSIWKQVVDLVQTSDAICCSALLPRPSRSFFPPCIGGTLFCWALGRVQPV